VLQACIYHVRHFAPTNDDATYRTLLITKESGEHGDLHEAVQNFA
jgi:hypothetical protein